uniref:Ribosomal protein S18 n=1 Tax=Cryptomonas sp. SAG 977-2f TaxID=279061 RepID=A0A679CAK5_9CRYP|nr:ribosomal protein S18 [Cryptomonas sp. SAG 977-2f]
MVMYRHRVSPLRTNEIIDYKDVELLSKFLTEQGKILPRRVTGLTTKQQSRLTKAVKKARIIALLPFISKDV